MDMDELQRAWGRIDLRLAEQDRELARLRRHRGMDRVRTRLRWLSLGQLLELLAGAGIVLWAGSYWYEHRAVTHLLVYGLVLHAYGIAMLALALTQLLWLLGIDYDAPVLAVQRKLRTLGRIRAFSGKWMLQAGMVAWVPLFLVAMRGIGLDLWVTRPAVVWANLAVGIVIAVGIEAYVRRYPERCGQAQGGEFLRRSRDEIDELAAGQSSDDLDQPKKS